MTSSTSAVLNRLIAPAEIGVPYHNVYCEAQNAYLFSVDLAGCIKVWRLEALVDIFALRQNFDMNHFVGKSIKSYATPLSEIEEKTQERVFHVLLKHAPEVIRGVHFEGQEVYIVVGDSFIKFFSNQHNHGGTEIKYRRKHRYDKCAISINHGKNVVLAVPGDNDCITYDLLTREEHKQSLAMGLDDYISDFNNLQLAHVAPKNDGTLTLRIYDWTAAVKDGTILHEQMWVQKNYFPWGFLLSG